MNDTIYIILSRMGEPSWLVLAALARLNEAATPQITAEIKAIYTQAEMGGRTIDASTLHHALRRMVDDGVIEQTGRRQVPVPGPYGRVYTRERTVYAINGLGREALAYHGRIAAAMSVERAFSEEETE